MSDELLDTYRMTKLCSALTEARLCARVLAHSYDHDTRPPDWALEMARSWDASGNVIATAPTEPPAEVEP